MNFSALSSSFRVLVGTSGLLLLPALAVAQEGSPTPPEPVPPAPGAPPVGSPTAPVGQPTPVGELVPGAELAPGEPPPGKEPPVEGAPAQGEAQGVLIRFEPGGSSIDDAPTVRLATVDGGETLEVELKDDGQPPDVQAGDGRWAGVALTSARAFQLKVEIDGEQSDLGKVEWPSEQQERDLVLTLSGGEVVASAGSPNSQPGLGPRTDASASSQPSPPASGGPAAVGGPMVPVVSNSTAAEDGWLWVALGAAALCLVGGLALVLRGGARSGASEVRLERAPEPPLFGPGTPCLHAGLSIWQVSEADRAAFLPTFIQSVAQHHRVMLVLPEGVPTPEVFGGPVYVCRDSSIREMEDHLIDIVERPGLPLVPIFVCDAPDDDEVLAFADLLDPDLGGVLLTPRPPAARPPDVRVALSPRGARLHLGESELDLRKSRLGYLPAP